MESKFIEIEETIRYGKETRKVFVNVRHIKKLIQGSVLCGVCLSGKDGFFETKETAESILQRINFK